MRAITVRQPWAWAIVHGGKSPENRTKNIAGPYRGPLAIHAGLTWDLAGAGSPLVRDAIERTGAPSPYAPDTDPTWAVGAIIGVVDLTDVHHAHQDRCACGPWAEPDDWHLCVTNPRPIDPIPARGMLGLWIPDDTVRRAIEDALQPSRLCATDRHPTCPGCPCTCHHPMSTEAARAVILRTAGARLWPDDPTRLVEQARRVNPFDPEFLTALDVLGLS